MKKIEETKIRIKVTDKKGKVLQDYEKECHSFVRQYLDVMYAKYKNTSYSVKDVSGTSRTVSSAVNNFNVNAGVSADYYGIVVGSDNTIVDIDDYSLGSIISDGNGAGELEYQASTINSPVVGSSSSYIEIERAFLNDSGNNVTVEETGVYIHGSWNIMIARDLLGTVTVPDGGALTVTWKHQTTVS